ncbi:MAG: Rne/Rng family ribonuclease [Hyphomicrobiaceae bacterium]
MSHNKMLIDASHPEETRVVVLRNGRVEEFDYESAARKLLRGSIYLAKVTRVEPSLQAGFVDYCGNRHGFLAFNEIHPDYYQIPVADRQALIDEEAAAEAEEEAEADARAEANENRRRRRPRHGQRSSGRSADDSGAEFSGPEPIDVTDLLPPEPTGEADESGPDGSNEAAAAPSEPTQLTEAYGLSPASDAVREPAVDTDQQDGARPHATEAADEAGEASEMSDVPVAIGNVEDVGVEEVEAPESAGSAEAEQVESVSGSEDALEELPSRPRRRPRSYKIQEVIKRRQIILVQVVKEERGTKGAALTTYLSLAGRYTVLMPNTARGGGISRKITNVQDRKRLKAIADELEVPEGMGLIIRTAGAARTKQEIKRDFEYLLRLWESVRELTLHSTAPSLVYEEGDLIKRSIRDLYSKEVEEIVVSGEAAFKEARDFMRMLMPSHVKNVVQYQDPEPLFTRYQIERQLNAMFSPYVHLRSGGYLVINQTEALVAVDVNSGKSTREFSIEETALATNLEAADEIARQLKLRDLAGLIVIDFIDMEENRNNRAVERRLKEALRFDRARIQVGRISHFGLMEMSRQRLRTGVLEGSTTQCPHCQGTGIIRSTESVALAVLRGLEDTLMNGPATSLVATTTTQVALYLLNNKRTFINDMEARSSITVTIAASDKVQGANFTIERVARAHEPQRRIERTAVKMDWGFDGEGEADGATAETDAEVEVEVIEVEEEARENTEGGREGGGRRRRGRRGDRGDRPERGERQPSFQGVAGETDGEVGPLVAGNGQDHDDVMPLGPVADDETSEGGPDDGGRTDVVQGEGEGEDARRRRGRRRGRRGGRRGRDRDGRVPGAANGEAGDEGMDAPFAADVATADAMVAANANERALDLPVEPSQPVPAEPSREARSEMAPVTVAVVPAIEVPVIADAAPPAAPVAPAKVAVLEVAVAEAIAEPEAPAADPRAPRTAPVSSTPVVARVVVGSEGAEEAEAKPVRRGWWSRK